MCVSALAWRLLNGSIEVKSKEDGMKIMMIMTGGQDNEKQKESASKSSRVAFRLNDVSMGT